MSNKILNVNMPTQLVVLGATGDLMAKKIVPALFHLFEKRELPASFRVVGVARRGMTDEEFQSLIFEKLSKHKDADIKMCTDFCKLFSYKQGEFSNKSDYLNLQKTLKTIDDRGASARINYFTLLYRRNSMKLFSAILPFLA